MSSKAPLNDSESLVLPLMMTYNTIAQLTTGLNGFIILLKSVV